MNKCLHVSLSDDNNSVAPVTNTITYMSTAALMNLGKIIIAYLKMKCVTFIDNVVPR